METIQAQCGLSGWLYSSEDTFALLQLGVIFVVLVAVVNIVAESQGQWTLWDSIL